MYLTIYHTTGEQVAQLRYYGRKIKVVSATNDKIANNLETTIDQGFDRWVGKPGREMRYVIEPHETRGLVQMLAYFYATQFGFVSVLTHGKPKKKMVLGKNSK